MNQKKIGFIGQGWIGKNYANDFENRGFEVIRYAKEKPYDGNAEFIKECDIVFIAVPTPTTQRGFDDSILRAVLPIVGKGKIAVIKSTVLPGRTVDLQKENPDIFVMHSPEFLSIATAAHDASFPDRNIVGIPIDNELYLQKAEDVLSVLPKAPYNKICLSIDAELVKYGRNCLGYVRVVFINLFYDFAMKLGADWVNVREAMSADPDNGPTYMNPVHKSGRGAGGDCFIKDFEAFVRMYNEVIGDEYGQDMLEGIKQKNIELLLSTHKDLNLLEGVYGKDILNHFQQKE